MELQLSLFAARVIPGFMAQGGDITHGNGRGGEWELGSGTTADLMWVITLPQTNSSHLKIGLPNRKVVFQPSIFRGYVSFREGNDLWLMIND